MKFLIIWTQNSLKYKLYVWLGFELKSYILNWNFQDVIRLEIIISIIINSFRS